MRKSRSGYITYEVGDKIKDLTVVDEEPKEGGLGRVYFCTCQKRSRKIVVKTVKERIWEEHKLNQSWKYLKDSIINNTPIEEHNLVGVGDYLLLAMFREARISCQITGHRNLVSGLDFWWTEEGQVFFECEYIENRMEITDLMEKVKLETGKPLGVLESVSLAISFCNAFIYINDEVVKSCNKSISNINERVIGFVHRDIKPQNILLTEKNELKIIDLGLAKFLKLEGGITSIMANAPKAGAILYMSQEQQLHFDAVTPASDIYSFGVTLYQMLGGNITLFMPQNRNRKIPALDKIPTELMLIIHKCLQTSADDRYQSFKELKEDLVNLLSKIKANKIGVKENQKCNVCGYVSNIPGTPGNFKLSTSQAENGHQFVQVHGGEYYKGCSKEHEQKIMAKWRNTLTRDSFKETYEKGYVDEFEIDIYPVTNRQYINFIKSTGYRQIPKNWNSDINKPYPKELENQPVIQVSYNDALAYCNWLGYRLPKGDEWEKAARGANGNLYPWGDVYSPKNCNCAESGNRGLVDVDKYENGISPYGCYQMVGNVYEWVDENHPEDNEYKYVRGGSWDQTSELVGLPFWHYLACGPNEKGDNIGFRVVRNSNQSIGAKTVIEKDDKQQCPVCKGEFSNFDKSEIKIPEKNVHTWIGYFDVD